MADILGTIRGIGEVVQGGMQVVRIMDEANKLRNATPELQADFIVKNLNDKEKLGVRFEREGTVAVGRLNKTQADNLINAYSQLSEDERDKLFGRKIDMKSEFIRDRNNPDQILGATLKIDAKSIKSWGEFSQAFDYFNGKDGSAPALKAAITTGDAAQVRKALGIEGQAPAQQTPSASDPAAPAPEKPSEPAKRRPWEKIFDKIKLPSGSPAPAGGESGPQSKAEQPIDVAALTTQLGLKAPSASPLDDSPSAPTFGGVAKAGSKDRGVA